MSQNANEINSNNFPYLNDLKIELQKRNFNTWNLKLLGKGFYGSVFQAKKIS